MSSTARAFALSLLLLACASCASPADSVCTNIGYCKSQSDDQIKACEAQQKQVAVEADASGCGTQYAQYFSCADSVYDCHGNQPVFPGCDASRAALDACLAQGRAHNACGALASKLAQCPGATAPDPSVPPTPCGALEVCSATCYLADVSLPCAPTSSELAGVAQCQRLCPF